VGSLYACIAVFTSDVVNLPGPKSIRNPDESALRLSRCQKMTSAVLHGTSITTQNLRSG
jgi:hypothetical protein